MKYDPSSIQAMIKAAIEKAELSYETQNFQELARIINDHLDDTILGGRYLYKMYNSSKNAIKANEKEIGLREAYVNLIPQYLGFKSFQDYNRSRVLPIDKTLQRCVGNWYSFARANSGYPYLLVAPVQIKEDAGTIKIEMRGGKRVFTGALKKKNEIIYCSFQNDPEKVLNLVFRMGYSLNPTLLMGVFSGISTGGDPIVGRELLWRSEQDYQNMRPLEVPLLHKSQWPSWIDPRIFHYFNTAEKNCLSGSRGNRFSLDDLDIVD